MKKITALVSTSFGFSRQTHSSNPVRVLPSAKNQTLLAPWQPRTSEPPSQLPGAREENESNMNNTRRATVNTEDDFLCTLPDSFLACSHRRPLENATMVPGTTVAFRLSIHCLLYTSDAADDLLCVDLGGR